MIVEHPEPLFEEGIEPTSFREALALHMRRHGDTFGHLAKAIIRPAERFNEATIQSWLTGERAPRSLSSLRMLSRIEHRYRLPDGSLKALLPHASRAATGHTIDGVGAAERRRLAWHLPDDLATRSSAEREEIVAWVRTNIVSGTTDYRRFQAAAIRHRYGLRFPGLDRDGHSRTAKDRSDEEVDASDPDLACLGNVAPAALAAELQELVTFKSATLTARGFRRSGVWSEETTAQKIEHLGLMFGALLAAPHAPVAGLGVPRSSLTLALLVFPAVWDWYVGWREQRRGFFTRWEVNMLDLGVALTRQGTGWLRQMPQLASRLRPIPSLVSAEDVAQTQADWASACDAMHAHGTARAREIARVARVHRDPFEPILVILEADSPVAQYRRITDEIVRRMPDARRYPRDAAEAVRSFLLLRLGLHLGLRQKNLRQLMFCPRGQPPRSERQLEVMRRGEIRWSDRASGWEVLVPSAAFKNAGSSFFGGKPFRLVLPDLDGLYLHLDAYVRTHRQRLLGRASDPGTFFVKTMKATSKDGAYDQTTFYEAWRLVIQRYGIWNPYTGRGAIKGLLPHGPHNIRDVLATHILKHTGSYEQAGYAIQDTAETVRAHYGRFLPEDKAALAAEVLNHVWRQ